MSNQPASRLALDDLSEESLKELTSRVEDLANSYRAVAEKMGQLFVWADENKAMAVTRGLDKPMRNSSENQQFLTELLERLRYRGNRG